MSVASVAEPATSQLAQDVAVIQAIEAELNQEVVESRDLVRILVLAALSKTHAFIAGEGGVGKSYGSERLMVRLPGRYFRTQFSKDMTRDELYGPPDIGALTNADGKGVRYERDVSGMFPEANLALGDEFADASTMIARSMLSPLNERIMRDGRQERTLDLWSFIATGNFWIEAHELQALFDRLPQRYVQQRVTSSEGFKQILRLGVERRANGGQTPSVAVTTLSADALARLHLAVDTCVVPEDILTVIDNLRQRAEAEQIVISGRRMQEAIKVAQALAILSGRTHVIEEDLQVFKFILPNHPDDFATAADLTVEFAGKVAMTVEGLRASFAEPRAKVDNIRQQVAAGADKDRERMADITKEIGLISDTLKSIKLEAKEKIDTFQAEGRDVSDLRGVLRDIESDQDFMRKLIFG